MVFIQLKQYLSNIWFNATIVQNIVPNVFHFLSTIQDFHLHLFGKVSLQQDFLAEPEAQISQRTLANSEKIQQSTTICPQCSNDCSMDSHSLTGLAPQSIWLLFLVEIHFSLVALSLLLSIYIYTQFQAVYNIIQYTTNEEGCYGKGRCEVWTLKEQFTDWRRLQALNNHLGRGG